MVFNLFISRVLKLCPWVEVVSVLTDCMLAAFSLAVGVLESFRESVKGPY